MEYSDYIKIYIVNYIAVLFEWFINIYNIIYKSKKKIGGCTSERFWNSPQILFQFRQNFDMRVINMTRIGHEMTPHKSY